MTCLDDLTDGWGQTDSTVNEYHCKQPPVDYSPVAVVPGSRVRVGVIKLHAPNQGKPCSFHSLAHSAYLLHAVVTWAGHLNSPTSRQITSKLYESRTQSGALNRFEVD